VKNPRELGETLDGEESPYILTDLRWGKGPLYVRYGAFAMRYTVDERGEPVPAIADGDGNLVADRRDPVFYVPPWVTLPAFLERISSRETRSPWPTCRTRSSGCCISPTAAASTPAPTPEPASRWC
jgi:hypothetical protein